jgi:hypothetical protein
MGKHPTAGVCDTCTERTRRAGASVALAHSPAPPAGAGVAGDRMHAVRGVPSGSVLGRIELKMATMNGNAAPATLIVCFCQILAQSNLRQHGKGCDL